MMQQPVTAATPTFEALYEEYREPLLRYTLSRLHGISEDDAADLVADAWLDVWRKLPDWTDRGVSIGAWLFSIMRNAIVDHLRANRGRVALRLDEDAHDPVDEAAESEVFGVLSDEIIEGVIAALDERQAEVIRLVYVENWRLSEIAQHYGVTLDAMKKLHWRALGRARTFLETGMTRRRRTVGAA